MMKFWVLPLLENWYYQVVLIYHEVFLRSLRINRFRREEFPREQVELFLRLQEVLTDRPDRSYVVVSVFHSWEDQARSSCNFEQLVEEKLSMNCSRKWWSEASNKSVSLSGRPDLSSPTTDFHGSWPSQCFFTGLLKLKRTEMAIVEQAQQMIPLITREISFG